MLCMAGPHRVWLCADQLKSEAWFAAVYIISSLRHFSILQDEDSDLGLEAAAYNSAQQTTISCAFQCVQVSVGCMAEGYPSGVLDASSVTEARRLCQWLTNQVDAFHGLQSTVLFNGLMSFVAHRQLIGTFCYDVSGSCHDVHHAPCSCIDTAQNCIVTLFCCRLCLCLVSTCDPILLHCS